MPLADSPAVTVKFEQADFDLLRRFVGLRMLSGNNTTMSAVVREWVTEKLRSLEPELTKHESTKGKRKK